MLTVLFAEGKLGGNMPHKRVTPTLVKSSASKGMYPTACLIHDNGKHYQEQCKLINDVVTMYDVGRSFKESIQ